MNLRGLLLALGAVVLCAATEPPAPLAPYVKHGRLDPGDYGWLKGRFDDATPQEREAFQAIQGWATQCREAALAELRARLSERGYANPDLGMVFVGPLLCQQAMFFPETDKTSFAAFQQELAVARPVTEAYLAAVGSAAEIAAQGAGPLDNPFIRRRVTDQALRSTLGGRPPAGFPTLSPAGAAIFRSRISVATFTEDHDNTEWLKAYVAEHGWPTISGTGQQTAQTAWLLAQHADADPLFQVQALELMKQNYALLYDRVMFKLAGKQRYGSQMHCDGGKLAPLPLEDAAAVNRLRAEVGLGTLEEYAAGMNQRSSSCGSAPPRAG